mgnify:CR=1 FL=1
MNKNFTLTEIFDKYENHKSVVSINFLHNIPENLFLFKEITTDELEKVIKDLNIKKWSLSNCIPAKILKENSNTYILYLKQIINQSIKSSTLPIKLKIAEVIPVYKKKWSLRKRKL